MKKYLAFFAVLGLLVACQGKENPSGGGEVTAISLDKTSINVEKGGNEVLSVSFTPANASNKTVSWVSSDPSIATVSDGVVVGVAVGSTEVVAKCGNATAKCAVTVVISATSIKLNKESLELHIDQKETLEATLEPSSTTDVVLWSSSDASVATVQDGLVTAVAEGTAKITAKVGSVTATCDIVVIKFKLTAVDLGLSVKWANANLGADSEEAFGDYYAWGETEPYYSSLDPLIWKEGKSAGYDWDSYKWCNGKGKITKYCTIADYWDGTGDPDGKMVLEPEDDAAYKQLGGSWRIPTIEECEELANNCTVSTSEINGIPVKVCESKKNGNSIILPLAGIIYNTQTKYVMERGRYWSSSLSLRSSTSVGQGGANAFALRYGDQSIAIDFSTTGDRSSGFSIRPVSD